MYTILGVDFGTSNSCVSIFKDGRFKIIQNEYGKYTTPTCTGVGDLNKCNTQSYVAAVNEAGLCGKKDWRMPNVDELRNWAHTGLGLPAVDGNYFPNRIYIFQQSF